MKRPKRGRRSLFSAAALLILALIGLTLEVNPVQGHLDSRHSAGLSNGYIHGHGHGHSRGQGHRAHGRGRKLDDDGLGWFDDYDNREKLAGDGDDEGGSALCRPPPTWTVGGVDHMAQFRGNVTVVALLAADCPFCIRQAFLFGAMKEELALKGVTANFVIVNEDTPRARSLIWKLTSAARGIVPVLQELRVSEPVWSVLGGAKDDFFIYDRCGRLTFHIPLPFSKLTSPNQYVKKAIINTFSAGPCGQCEPVTEKPTKLDDDQDEDQGVFSQLEQQVEMDIVEPFLRQMSTDQPGIDEPSAVVAEFDAQLNVEQQSNTNEQDRQQKLLLVSENADIKEEDVIPNPIVDIDEDVQQTLSDPEVDQFISDVEKALSSEHAASDGGKDKLRPLDYEVETRETEKQEKTKLEGLEDGGLEFPVLLPKPLTINPENADETQINQLNEEDGSTKVALIAQGLPKRNGEENMIEESAVTKIDAKGLRLGGEDIKQDDKSSSEEKDKEDNPIEAIVTPLATVGEQKVPKVPGRQRPFWTNAHQFGHGAGNRFKIPKHAYPKASDKASGSSEETLATKTDSNPIFLLNRRRPYVGYPFVRPRYPAWMISEGKYERHMGQDYLNELPSRRKVWHADVDRWPTGDIDHPDHDIRAPWIYTRQPVSQGHGLFPNPKSHRGWEDWKERRPIRPISSHGGRTWEKSGDGDTRKEGTAKPRSASEEPFPNYPKESNFGSSPKDQGGLSDIPVTPLTLEIDSKTSSQNSWGESSEKSSKDLKMLTKAPNWSHRKGYKYKKGWAKPLGGVEVKRYPDFYGHGHSKLDLASKNSEVLTEKNESAANNFAELPAGKAHAATYGGNMQKVSPYQKY